MIEIADMLSEAIDKIRNFMGDDFSDRGEEFDPGQPARIKALVELMELLRAEMDTEPGQWRGVYAAMFDAAVHMPAAVNTFNRERDNLLELRPPVMLGAQQFPRIVLDNWTGIVPLASSQIDHERFDQWLANGQRRLQQLLDENGGDYARAFQQWRAEGGGGDET